MRRALVVWFALGCGAAAAAPPVTGGTASDDGAVVALAYGDVLVCSGTLIAPHAVLTAAHCLTGSHLPELAVGDTLAGAARHPIIAAFVHPDFDAQTLDHDIAVAIVAPLAGAPVLPFATVLGELAAGATLRVVGFGWTVANDTSPPARRTGESRLDAIEPLRLVSHAAMSQTCEGDSGGPALIPVGAGERVIGVASSGDATCTEVARYTRVDVHADFVADVAARTAPGAASAGDRCWYAENCAVGGCLPAVDEPRWSFCAPACDGGCPAGLACITVGGDARCRHPAPSPGADGAPCANDADCAGALCLAAAMGGEQTCTSRCFSDLPGFACEGGTTCGEAADGSEACFAPEDRGGCNSMRGTRGLFALAILALCAQALRGRGRP